MDVKRKQTRRISGKRTLLLGSLGLMSLALVLSIANNGFGDPEKKAKPAKVAKADPGLRGLLPFEVPDALVGEEFEILGEKWASWSKKTSDSLIKLYEDEKLDTAGQRKVLATLNAQLKVLHKAASDPAHKSVKDQISAIHGRLSRRVDIATAALDSLSADPNAARKARIKSAGQGVLEAIKTLKSFLSEYENGSIWLGYVRETELTKAIQKGDTAAAVLTAVQKRLADSAKLKQKAQREFLGKSAFTGLGSALKKLADTRNAPANKVNLTALRAELKKLITAIEAYEDTNSVVASANVRTSFDVIRGLSADEGAALADAMRTHYVNYNFRLYISEAFLNRLIDEKRVERDAVNDNVLGARVTGTQTTTTRVSIDLRNSSRNALMDIVLSGVTQTNTIGVTSQATIRTVGRHTWTARQGVSFDGDQFSLRNRVRMSVNANNQTTSARTKISGIPLIGPISNGIAMNVARGKRSQSEAITSQKLADRVRPEFRKEIEETFARANKEMKERVLKQLKSAGLMPEARSVRTTDHYLLLSGRVMTNSELGGAKTNPTESPGSGLTIRLHESVLNNAIDKIGFAGRKMTSSQIRDEVRKSLSDFLGDDYDKNSPKTKAKKEESKTDKFIFDASDPIRIQIRDGQLNIVIRCGLEQAGKEPIPMQIITVPLKISIVKDQISIVRGSVSVAPAATPKSRAKQIVRAGIMRKKIQSAIDNETRKRTLTFEQKGKKPLVVTITKIKSVNGWLTVWAK